MTDESVSEGVNLEQRVDSLEESVLRQSEIITDIVLRVNALERLLIKLNTISSDEFEEELSVVKNELLTLFQADLIKK